MKNLYLENDVNKKQVNKKNEIYNSRYIYKAGEVNNEDKYHSVYLKNEKRNNCCFTIKNYVNDKIKNNYDLNRSNREINYDSYNIELYENDVKNNELQHDSVINNFQKDKYYNDCSIITTITGINNCHSSNNGVNKLYDNNEVSLAQKVRERKQYKKRKFEKKIDDLFNYKKYKENLAKVLQKNSLTNDNNKQSYNLLSKNNTQSENINEKLWFVTNKESHILHKQNNIINRSQNAYQQYFDTAIENESNWESHKNDYTYWKRKYENLIRAKDLFQNNFKQLYNNKIDNSIEDERSLHLNDTLQYLLRINGKKNEIETFSFTNKIYRHLYNFINNEKTKECLENETFVEVLETKKLTKSKNYMIFFWLNQILL